jgi:hypothetical protein
MILIFKAGTQLLSFQPSQGLGDVNIDLVSSLSRSISTYAGASSVKILNKRFMFLFIFYH